MLAILNKTTLKIVLKFIAICVALVALICLFLFFMLYEPLFKKINLEPIKTSSFLLKKDEISTMEVTIPHDGLYRIGVGIRYEGVSLQKNSEFPTKRISELLYSDSFKKNFKIEYKIYNANTNALIDSSLVTPREADSIYNPLFIYKINRRRYNKGDKIKIEIKNINDLTLIYELPVYLIFAETRPRK